MTVLLDTNIWRYLSDSGRGGELLRLAGKYPASIAICPTSVLEVQKLQNTSIKKNILNLMTNENLFRLSPDAYSESMEFIHAVIKLRPDWLKRICTAEEQELYDKAVWFWKGKRSGFWYRTRKLAGKTVFQSNVDNDYDSALDNLYKEQRIQEHFKSLRQKIQKARLNISLPDINELLLDYYDPSLPAALNTRYESWRVHALYSSILLTTESGYKDWVSPFVKLDTLIGRYDLKTFWLTDVEPAMVPRWWMRSIFQECQSFRKFNSGSPGDQAISTYLVEVDEFVTADKRFVELIDHISETAPFDLAKATLIKSGNEGIDQLFDIVVEHLT